MANVSSGQPVVRWAVAAADTMLGNLEARGDIPEDILGDSQQCKMEVKDVEENDYEYIDFGPLDTGNRGHSLICINFSDHLYYWPYLLFRPGRWLHKTAGERESVQSVQSG